MLNLRHVSQLVEKLVYIQNVGGSNPSLSIILAYVAQLVVHFLGMEKVGESYSLVGLQ
jgi:hypothetical protein